MELCILHGKPEQGVHGEAVLHFTARVALLVKDAIYSFVIKKRVAKPARCGLQALQALQASLSSNLAVASVSTSLLSKSA
jgi:hypothetical protein